jgi:hypothetical protein
MIYKLTATAGYFAVLTAFAHSSGEGVADWIAFTVIFVVPLMVGVVAGLWGLVVPPVVVLLAIQAGDRVGEGELPLSVVMLFVFFVAVPEIVIGWGARWLASRCFHGQSAPSPKL